MARKVMRLLLLVAVAALAVVAVAQEGQEGQEVQTQTFSMSPDDMDGQGAPFEVFGIDPKDKHLYVPGPEGEFRCLDGRGAVHFMSVNDDFCECTDGSDEPGTSACPAGTFFCVNKGSVSKRIPSNRVDDLVCDCCDGSDENSGLLTCENTCEAEGAALRAEQEERDRVTRAGLESRAALVDFASTRLAEKRARLDSLRAQLPELDAKVASLTDRADAATKAEKIALEEYEALRRDSPVHKALLDAAELAASKLDPIIDILREAAESKATLGDIEEVRDALRAARHPFHESIEVSASKLGRTATQLKDGSEAGRTVSSELEGIVNEITLAVNAFEDGSKDGEFLVDDDGTPSAYPEEVVSVMKKTWSAVTGRLYSFFGYVPPTAAQSARASLDSAKDAKRDVDNEITSLEKILSTPYGPSDAFFALHGECATLDTVEYTYEVCFFDKTEQKAKKGGATTLLGRWGEWDGDSFNEQIYKDGLKCWQGPDRLTRVEFVCGASTELLSAEEPARCEYTFKVATPIVCRETVQEAEAEVEEEEDGEQAGEKAHGHGHDEL